MALTDGIIGCWSPSVRGSGYLLPDLSGRGNHGTLTNMDAGTDWPGATVRGVSGRVLDFDGTNDYVTAGINGLRSLTSVTLSVWANITSTSQAMFVNARSTNTIFNFFVFGGSISLRGGSATAVLVSAPSGTTNNWRHFLATIRDTTGTIYYDGGSLASGTVTAIGASPTGLDIGAYSDFGGGYYLAGQLGEVAIYNRALTQPEVLELYRSGNGAIGRQLTGQTRRRVYGFVPAGFRAYWARRQNQIIGGGV